MPGASTGRDPLPSAPETPGKAPMNPPGAPNANGPESSPDATAGQDSSVAPADPASSDSVSPEPPSKDTPKKHHLLIPIPSRRSSKTDKQSASERTEEAAGGGPTRRGSRVSILKVKRDRSRASSKGSRRTRDVVNGDENKETTTAPETTEPAKPQKKRPSNIFAFLSCCSSPDADADDTTVPAKKTAKRQPTSNRLPTPDKAEAHNGDSSTAESKEPAYFGDEKANSTVTADQSQSHEQRAAGAQGEGTSAGAKQPEAPSLDSKERHGDHASTTVNGAVPESKTGQSAVRFDEQTTAGTEDTTAAEPTSKRRMGGDGTEDSSHEEDVIQSPPVLPPPPPLAPPAPQVRSTSEEGDQQWLLPAPLPHLQNRKCLVLDLDETLVHSSFKVLERADFTIPVEIEGQYHNIYVIKRPGVDQFMKRVGELYEVVVFTASVSKYGDPLLDQLDIHNVVHHRLFRESCYNHQGNYVKDLSQVGRDLQETIIIDNSPTSYIFHPQHAIPISSWFSDAHDNELLDLIPVLEDLAGAQVQDVSMVLDITL
ncbi:hypothetical protein NUU61_009388 [Penicillium alfredii]|uniref:FCP1 homology domain-containing protein n=1 Tax=Penicillium alfredii TaxID=1506179 RepID=A0A9W9JWV1_9EURO|nr:uncharacterized protein NUU61_009388 [Penicillium alfredii]KAJ5084809.1 hypothetical protein NUU61_009388 [Penicillium alfredii]